MFGSLRLGKFFGIDVYIHGTFWLLPLVILLGAVSAGATLEQTAAELLFIFVIFGCVVLHEVGHALAARAFGVATRDITLYPIGGVASLERIPEHPWWEIAIALAGPAVNLLIAGGLFAGLIAGTLIFPWSGDTYEPLTVQIFVFKVFWANVMLAGFNLLPCFPMDGGRVLRAVLAMRMNRVRATEIAAGVGSVVAGLFMVVGLVFGIFGLMILAFVVFLLGQAELAAVRATAAEEEARRRLRFRSWLGWPHAAFVGRPVLFGYTGLLWDDRRGVWVQYLNGIAVREIPPYR